MGSKRTSDGIKARQTEFDDPNRVFSDFLREQSIPMRDIDFYGERYQIAFTLSRADERHDGKRCKSSYLSSIDSRRDRDGDEKAEIDSARCLGRVPLLVLFFEKSEIVWWRRIPIPFDEWWHATTREKFGKLLREMKI